MSWRGWERLADVGALGFLAEGLLTTIELAVLANIISFGVGLLVGTYRALTAGLWRWPATIYTDALRNVPVLVLLFFMRFAPPTVGLRMSSFVAALVALSLYNSAHLAEIVRAGIASVPTDQTQAALASGLGRTTILWSVIYPQAIANMLPAFVSQFVILVKATSLATAINVIELTRAGQILFARYGNPLEVFTVIALTYFAFNYTISTVIWKVYRRRLQWRSGSEAPSRSGLALSTDA